MGGRNGEEGRALDHFADVSTRLDKVEEFGIELWRILIGPRSNSGRPELRLKCSGFIYGGLDCQY